MADEGHLAYTEVGSGDPVVFVHGLTCNRQQWQPVVDRLPDRYRRISVDMLGHGESPRGESADLFQQVAALGGLLEHLGVGDPVLVGHSYGAFTVSFAATAMPVRGVVNIDQRFDLVEFVESLRPYEARLKGDDFDAAIAEYFTWFRTDLIPAEWRELCEATIEPRQDVVLEVWGDLFDGDLAALQSQVESALPAVTAPYLAIFGAPITEEERRLQALIPEGTSEVWDGLGHFVQLADPDRTAARITAFVDSLPRRDI